MTDQQRRRRQQRDRQVTSAPSPPPFPLVSHGSPFVVPLAGVVVFVNVVVTDDVLVIVTSSSNSSSDSFLCRCLTMPLLDCVSVLILMVSQ